MRGVKNSSTAKIRSFPKQAIIAVNSRIYIDKLRFIIFKIKTSKS